MSLNGMIKNMASHSLTHTEDLMRTMLWKMFFVLLLCVPLAATAQHVAASTEKKLCESDTRAASEVTEGVAADMIATYNRNFGAAGKIVLCAFTAKTDEASISALYRDTQGSGMLVIWINHTLAEHLDPRIIPFIAVREMAREASPGCHLNSFPEYFPCEGELDKYGLQQIGGPAIVALNIMYEAFRQSGTDTMLAIQTEYRGDQLRAYQQTLASSAK